MSFRNGKFLGGVGAFLIVPLVFFRFLAFFFRVTYVSNIFIVVCLFLMLHGIFNLSKFYKNPNIFTNARIGTIFVLIGFLFLSVGDFVSPIKTTSLFACWSFLAIFTVFCTVGTYFLKCSIDKLATYLKSDNLIAAGKVMFVGAILTGIFIG
jgi:uncharacterized membrane protein